MSENEASERGDAGGELQRLRAEVEHLWSRDVARELKLSEAKYRALVEGSSDFIYVLDKDGYFTFANQEVEHLLGYTAEEIIGKHYSEVLHPQDAERLRYAFAERRTGERATRRVEVRLTSRGGVTRDVEMDIRHFSLSASGIYQDESFVGTHGVCRDITERKYQENKQRALGEIHRAVWGMARADDIQQVLDGIRDALDIVGLPHAELGVCAFDMDEPPVLRFYGTYGSDGIEKKGEWIVGDGRDFAATMVDIWRGGTPVHLRSLEGDGGDRGREHLRQLYGEIESMVDVPFSHGVLTVTTRDARFSSRDLDFLGELAAALSDGFRRVEDLVELTLSEQRYRRLVETPHLVVMLLDAEGNFLYVSPQIRELGYEPQAFYDDPGLLARIVHPDDQHLVAALGGAGARPQRDIEYRWRATDDTYHWMSASVFPIYESEEEAQIHRLSMVQVVVQDISERKRAEDLIRSSLAEKEVLLKEIHHRVKNNLQIVSSLLDLQSRGLPAEEKHVFEDSQNRINTMALIHEELYNSADLARIDFEEYARNLVHHLLSTYNPTGVLIDVQVDAPALNLDRAIPLGLIINELVSNALKYAFPDDRPGRIAISFQMVGEDGFALKVSDDGVGIREEIDLSAPRTLGLKLVHTLAAQLKARVQLEREGGTVFSLVRDPS